MEKLSEKPKQTENGKRWEEIFAVGEPVSSCEAYGNGHINDTFYLTTESGRGYILQKINEGIFPEPDKLMENICKVTEFLKKKISAAGADPLRETLHVVAAVNGKSWYRDEQGNAYRMYLFVPDAISLDLPETTQDFYECGVAFGRFQSMLADYPAHTLHELLPRFHDTRKRYEDLLQAAREDVCGRAADVRQELEFFMERSQEYDKICRKLADGTLPQRVTHNDTKLNNVLLDARDRKALCVIDLDTVMPGSALYDFGDAIRTGASTAAEDETELSKVSLDLSMYRAFSEGYLRECEDSLTDEEKKLLPVGAKLMTMECGMRFLADYLQGDVYFKIHREKHNLDRARTQIALAADMERKWKDMRLYP